MKTFRHLVNTARVDDEGFQTPISSLAQESGYSRAYFYKLMEGDFADLPPEDRLKALAKALSVPVARVKAALKISWDAAHA
tara:strand:+ start:153 stop:395 length:243 start_codon:yes stop_codon:yes gene_type:complete